MKPTPVALQRAILDLKEASGFARTAAERLVADQIDIAALRAAVANASEDARLRAAPGAWREALAGTEQAARRIDLSRGAALAPKLLGFAEQASRLAELLLQTDEPELAQSEHGPQGIERLLESVRGILGVARAAIERNDQIADDLQSALIVLSRR